MTLLKKKGEKETQKREITLKPAKAIKDHG